MYYSVLQSEMDLGIMGTLTIRLDDKLDRELKQLAKKQRRTKSDVARDLLRRYIRVREFDEIRDKLRPYAEAAGTVTDEDFFRDIS